MRKKIQEDTFNDPVSTPYGKANSSLRPDSFLKSLVILKIFALAALVQKFVRMTSDFKKLFTGPGKNDTWPLFDLFTGNVGPSSSDDEQDVNVESSVARATETKRKIDFWICRFRQHIHATGK